MKSLWSQILLRYNHLFWTMSFISAIYLLINIKIVNSIVVPEFQEFVEKNNADKTLINIETREIYENVQDMSRTIPCLISFVKTYLNAQPSRIPVLLPELSAELTEIAQLYLSSLHDIRSTYVLSGQWKFSTAYTSTLSALIILKDSIQLTESNLSNSSFVQLCGRDCKYLVALTNPFPDEETFLQESNQLVQLLWIGRVANVVFLGVVGQTVLVSRSLSFKPNIDSEPSTPQLVSECDENTNWSGAKWSAYKEMYSPLEMNNCIVYVAFFDYEPYATRDVDDSLVPLSPNITMFAEDSNITDNNANNFNSDGSIMETTFESLRLGGIEGLIVKTLASSLNFVISSKEIPWVEGGNVAAEVNEALWGIGNEAVDMVLGGLPWAPENETDYTLPYAVVQFVWLIPMRPNVSLRGLIAPLQINVWYAALGLLVFAGLSEYIVARNIAFLEILSLVIGVAWPKQPIKLSARIRFMSWVIFGYILTQFYLASLAGQLMASSAIQIETLKELVSSSFEIGGSVHVQNFFMLHNDSEVDEDTFNNAEITEINSAILDKFQVFEHNELIQHYNDLISEKNQRLAIGVRMNISAMKPSFEGRHVHKMKEALGSHPLSFAVWRGMPYLSVFDQKISSLVEGGVVDYYAKTISFASGEIYNTDMHDNKNNVSLQALAPGFLLLIMGYGFSCVFLLLEIIVYRWKTRRKNDVNTPNFGSKIKSRKLKPVRRTTISKREGHKLPEVLSTTTWIAGHDHRDENKLKTAPRNLRRVHFPSDFIN